MDKTCDADCEDSQSPVGESPDWKCSVDVNAGTVEDAGVLDAADGVAAADDDDGVDAGAPGYQNRTREAY